MRNLKIKREPLPGTGVLQGPGSFLTLAGHRERCAKRLIYRSFSPFLPNLTRCALDATVE